MPLVAHALQWAQEDRKPVEVKKESDNERVIEIKSKMISAHE